MLNNRSQKVAIIYQKQSGYKYYNKQQNQWVAIRGYHVERHGIVKRTWKSPEERRWAANKGIVYFI